MKQKLLKVALPILVTILCLAINSFITNINLKILFTITSAILSFTVVLGVLKCYEFPRKVTFGKYGKEYEFSTWISVILFLLAGGLVIVMVNLPFSFFSRSADIYLTYETIINLIASLLLIFYVSLSKNTKITAVVVSGIVCLYFSYKPTIFESYLSDYVTKLLLSIISLIALSGIFFYVSLHKDYPKKISGHDDEIIPMGIRLLIGIFVFVLALLAANFHWGILPGTTVLYLQYGAILAGLLSLVVKFHYLNVVED